VTATYQKEMLLMCRLEHPNIISCYGMIIRDDDDELVMWCVMEKLEIDLFKAISTGVLHKGKDIVPSFVSMLGSFVSALAYLHSPVSHQTCLFFAIFVVVFSRITRLMSTCVYV